MLPPSAIDAATPLNARYAVDDIMRHAWLDRIADGATVGAIHIGIRWRFAAARLTPCPR